MDKLNTMCPHVGVIIDFPIYTWTYLGYSKSPKFREWISDLSPEELKRIEAGRNQLKVWRSRYLWSFFSRIWSNDRKRSVLLQIGLKDGSCVTLPNFVQYDVCNQLCVHVWLGFHLFTAVHVCRKYHLELKRVLDGMVSVRGWMATSGTGGLPRTRTLPI